MNPKKVKKLLRRFEKEEKLNFFCENRYDYAETAEIVMQALRSGHLDMLEGNLYAEFEKQFAEWLGVKHAIFTNSGTAALFVALRAADIGPGDEVIVPPFSFIATATAVLHNNALPVFADIDPKTYNLDPHKAIEKITEKTKAIIPVHLGGMPADLDPLMEVCKEKDIFVLEDACQSHGALYKGKQVGTIGDTGAFSFFPSKNMMTGEGGMTTTNNDELAEQMRIIRHHGESDWYKFERLGWNLRPTELQSAVGIAQMKSVKRNIQKRQMAWWYLTESLKGVKGVEVPYVPDYAEPSCNWWGAIVKPEEVGMKDATEFTIALNSKSPFTKVLYPKPLYKTIVFQKGDTFLPFEMPEHPDGLCPDCEELNKVLIGIDTHHELTKEHCDLIISQFKSIAEGK